jgi:hypothetical protein
MVSNVVENTYQVLLLGDKHKFVYSELALQTKQDQR